MFRAFAALLVAAGFVTGSAAAQERGPRSLTADDSADETVDVVVLGLRSVEGDDARARALTEALRREAAAVPGWRLLPADVSLSQMSLVHGCAEPDAACLAAIAEDLGAGRVVYGTFRRTGDTDIALTLYLFDGDREQITESLRDTVAPADQDDDARARRYLAELAGRERFGGLRLVTEAGARVRIDGEPVGAAASSGVLLVDDLPEGARRVEVEAPGRSPFAGEVTVVADEVVELRASLPPAAERRLGWVPGALVLATSTVFFGLGVRSWRQVRRYDDERNDVAGRPQSEVLRLRDALLEGNALDPATGMPTGPVDPAAANLTPFQAMLVLADQTQRVCVDGTFMVAGGQSACDTQDRQRVLQYVFHGLGLATAGVGAFLLVRGLRRDRDAAAAEARFELRPHLGLRRAGAGVGVQARLRF
ncbi:MAG: PEGA domain-containing protein [Myxococcota bacterium]